MSPELRLGAISVFVVAAGAVAVFVFPWANKEVPASHLSRVTLVTGQDLLGAAVAETYSTPNTWIVGDHGYVLRGDRTTNKWSHEAIGTNARLRAVATDGTYVMVVGDGGAILRRDADGRWTPLKSGTTANLEGVALLQNGAYTTEGTTFVVVGAGGTMLKCNATCRPVSSGTTKDLHAVSASSRAGYEPNHVVAVGDGGTLVIHRSSDPNGGWKTVQVGTNDLLGVAVWSSGHAVAVGRHGALYATKLDTDDSSKWEAEKSGTTQDLVAIGAGDVRWSKVRGSKSAYPKTTSSFRAIAADGTTIARKIDAKDHVWSPDEKLAPGVSAVAAELVVLHGGDAFSECVYPVKLTEFVRPTTPTMKPWGRVDSTSDDDDP